MTQANLPTPPATGLRARAGRGARRPDPRFSPAVAWFAVALAIALGAGLSGCARRSTNAGGTAPPPPPTGSPGTLEAAPSEPGPAPATEPRFVELETVYLDFDSYALRESARASLDRSAKRLRDEADLRITIEGHCDERGSAEYNQALGERRARAVRDYLVESQVSAARILVISYGKERPLDPGHGERAWARNRRAEFVVQSGPN